MTFTTQDAFKAARSRGMRAAHALKTARLNLAKCEEAAAASRTASEAVQEARANGGDVRKFAPLPTAYREERARLAEGDSSPFIFYPDSRLKAAFCEGANLSEYPT